VRIYPAVVLRGSPLETMYENGVYTPLSLDDCVSVVKKIYLYFSRKNIKVVRVGLQATEDFEKGTEIIAGPYHPAFGHMVMSAIFLDMARLAVKKFFNKNNKNKQKSLIFNVHPRDISKMRGLKNCNIVKLKSETCVESVDVISNNSVLLNTIKLGNVVVDDFAFN
jgi:histone acetyltransferase (RNA polymerase elongator complex component)